MKKINPLSKIAAQLGKIGGKKSIQVRFSGKSKAEISEIMRNVRYSKKDLKETAKISKAFGEGLNNQPK